MLHITFSVVAHYSRVKWGHNLYVCIDPPILMSTRFVPSVQNQALKANVLIHKVEWTTLLLAHVCNVQNRNHFLFMLATSSTVISR